MTKEVALNIVSLRKALEIVEYTIIPAGETALITGAPGTAKTASLVELAQRLQSANWDFGSAYMNLGAAESVEITGLYQVTEPHYPLTLTGMPPWMQPFPGKGLRGVFPNLCPPHLQDAPDAQREMPAHLADTYAIPVTERVLSRQMRSYNRNFLIIDEATSTGDPTVEQPMSRLAHDKAVGAWQLNPEKTAVVMLGNEAAHRSGARNPMAHLANRMAHFQIRMDPEDYLHYWAKPNYVFPDQPQVRVPLPAEFRYFAGWMAGTVFVDTVPATNRYPTPRSFEKAARLAKFYCWNALGLSHEEDMPLTDPALMQLVASCCGDSLAQDFVTYMPHYTSRVTLADVLNDPKKVPLPSDAVGMHIFIGSMVDGLNPHAKGTLDAARIVMKRVPPLYCGLWITRMAQHYGLSATMRTAAIQELMSYAGVAATAPLLSVPHLPD